MSFRGIVLSIASLAYHGLGFDPGRTARSSPKCSF